MCRMQHLYVRTAACPIPRPLLVHYPRKTLGHLAKDQELGNVKDVCPCHCSHLRTGLVLLVTHWSNACCNVHYLTNIATRLDGPDYWLCTQPDMESASAVIG